MTTSVSNCEVLIAGAGPAGLATALYLLRARPELAGRVIALEKAAHPRFKTCAGGLIPKTMLALEELGLELEVPACIVMRGAARTPVGAVDLDRGEPLCTIIRRDEFDARLARAARTAGLEIVEHTRVLEVAQSADQVSVETDRGIFEARVLVGADGSGSRVRAAVFGSGKESIGRALMADIPVDPRTAVEFAEHRYRFDFRCVSVGIPGYAWSFPCLIDGNPHLNVGIYDQHPRASGAAGGEQAQMLTELRAAFPELPLAALENHTRAFRAFPIRWFDARDRYVNGRVILAGDAAGVDPLMGEGISCAFEHGKLAAAAIARMLGGDSRALAAYDRELHRGAVGRKLNKLAFAARHFYGPRYRSYFRMAGISRRARDIGVDWYNGAHHTDQRPTRALVARWMREVFLGAAVR
ncbi:MAG TPA: NAD(P)/FAD-dependent oxidoreductase [Candidatus Binataceae bacterium]|nr:NAD(P)/FAD-dependent oxidoreductase [Candidatus Binataceae bacterium]